VQIVVGIPMVSSAGNLDFWLRLCGVRHLPECSDLLVGFPRQGDLGKEAFNAAVKQWNADLIQRVGVQGWTGSGVGCRPAIVPCVLGWGWEWQVGNLFVVLACFLGHGYVHLSCLPRHWACLAGR